MARKFGFVECVADGQPVTFKGTFESDINEIETTVEKGMDNTTISYETPKVAKVSGTIQLRPGQGVNDVKALAGKTVRCAIGPLTHILPGVLVNLTGGVNEKGEIGIEFYPTAAPIEEVVT